MAKRREQSVSSTRAVKNTLARLGMQASPTQVIAALAQYGIVLTEEQVRQVKLEMLTEAAQGERQRVKVVTAQRPRVRRPPKLPPRRGHRP